MVALMIKFDDDYMTDELARGLRDRAIYHLSHRVNGEFDNVQTPAEVEHTWRYRPPSQDELNRLELNTKCLVKYDVVRNGFGILRFRRL